MVDIFLRARVALDPAGAEIGQLHAAGVSTSRIVTLYPYAFANWLPGLAAASHTMPADHNMAARLNGIATGVGRLPARVDSARYVHWRAELLAQNKDELYDLLGGAEGDLMYGELHAREDNFAAVHELLELAADWATFPYLHAHEVAHAQLLHAGLSAIAPATFTMAAPPLIEPQPWQATQFMRAKRALV